MSCGCNAENLLKLGSGTYVSPIYSNTFRIGTLVEISFDKVVDHLFIDFMSLVTHEELPWLGRSIEILQIWPGVPNQIARNRSLRLLQIFFISRVAESNWWLWIWVHGKMYPKNISVSVAFKMFFFATRIKIFMSAIQLKPCLKQLNRAHAWSYQHEVS